MKAFTWIIKHDTCMVCVSVKHWHTYIYKYIYIYIKTYIYISIYGCNFVCPIHLFDYVHSIQRVQKLFVVCHRLLLLVLLLFLLLLLSSLFIVIITFLIHSNIELTIIVLVLVLLFWVKIWMAVLVFYSSIKKLTKPKLWSII